jgi:hypothetical protein
MKATTTQFRHVSQRQYARPLLCILCASSFLTGGCFLRRSRAKTFPWSTFAYTRPIAPGSQISDPQLVDDAPDLSWDVAPPPSPLVAIRSTPPRPRVPAGSPTANDVPSKPDVPQIAPQLTPAEASAAQQQMNESLNVAERNIGATRGRNLNATQSDLASKIRSFIAEARDAANVGDWTRARNAAKKAQVLSEELANSL